MQRVREDDVSGDILAGEGRATATSDGAAEWLRTKTTKKHDCLAREGPKSAKFTSVRDDLVIPGQYVQEWRINT